MVNAASENVQNSEGKMKVTQRKKEMVRDSWDEKEDKRKFQEQERTKNRSEMRTPPGTV